MSRRRWPRWPLLLIGLAGLLAGPNAGNGLLIAGGLLVTAAALTETS